MIKPFKDRETAGRQLAQKLIQYKGKAVVVLGIPRGGVPVAAEIANILNCPLDVLLCKKIGHPTQKEYAIGAVSLTDSYLIPHENVDPLYIVEEIKIVRQRLEEMKKRFSVNNHFSTAQKTVILADDGMATGRTMIAAIRLLRKSYPLKIILAIPVASASAKQLIISEVDELVILYEPEWFTGVGAFYENFEEVTDEEVIQLLSQHHGEFNTASSN
jgi:putative phosphoribosyl transferase